MIFIDTNIFLRAILDDHTSFSPACKNLFFKIKNEEIHGISSDLVVAEIVFILQRQTKKVLSRVEIFKLVGPLLSLRQLKTPAQKYWKKIFEVYIQRNVDFIDAYNIVVMEATGIKKAYTYDRDFDKTKLLQRIEP